MKSSTTCRAASHFRGVCGCSELHERQFTENRCRVIDLALPSSGFWPDEELCLHILSLGVVASGLRQVGSPDGGLLQSAEVNPTSSERLV